MVYWLLRAGGLLRAGLGLAVVAAQLCLLQPSAKALSFRHKKPSADSTPKQPTVTSSQPPAFSIPVEPLGFYPPGAFYQGQRESLVSLDFLDESHLLFTFRAPGLIHREGATAGEDERQIRAEVLNLPQGTMESEALWTLHDNERYLWMLREGKFLLRDQDTLKEGDATLELKSLLQFPGPLLWLEMDPSEQYLVTDSHEPATTARKPGQVDSPATAQASVTSDNPQPGLQSDQLSGQPETVLRILRRTSGQVMLISRVRTTVHLPINSDGYLETLRASGREWMLDLNFFTGGSKILGRIDSACEPPVEFVSHSEALANTCVAQGGRMLVAFSTEGHRLWNAPAPSTQIWPLLVMAPDGSRLARETLTVSHPVDTFSPLSYDDVIGQLVEVFDAEGGRLALKAPASPILDGGGNVAISPSGKRVAVLNEGAIQVYELPPAPAREPASGRSTP